MTGDRKRLFVMTWDSNDQVFTPLSYLKIEVNGTIEAAVTGDFDYDGLLDVLVTWKSDISKFTQVFLQKNESFNESGLIEIPQHAQPAVFDIDGDLEVEIIVNKDDSVKVFKFHNFSFVELSTLENFSENDEICLDFQPFHLSFPHSFAFVDLNKDCRSDLFMTVNRENQTFFEIWLNKGNGKFCKVLSEKTPPGTRQVNFADIDRDGIEDVIFPVCLGEGCLLKSEIHIVLNKNKVSDKCEFNITKLGFFKLDSLSSEEETSTKIIIKTQNPLFDSPEFPITPRFGDFDQDGFPDLLITLQNSSTSFIQLFENQKNPQKPGFRTLEPVKNQLNDHLDQISNVLISCFFDLNEDGILDVLLIRKNEDILEILSFFNFLQNDRFHLKALALNGHSRGGYSSVYPGAVFVFTLTEMDMSIVVIEATQMTLTSFFALNTPYNVFGLGRTNSYIEEFYLALPVKGKNTRSWTPIIPNSYLIASPNSGDPDSWFLELFASPTDQIELIMGVSFGCMTIIGSMVVLNYCKDKKENRRLFGVRVLD
jgi:integrin alpha FG-GAP repeat containing protein 1